MLLPNKSVSLSQRVPRGTRASRHVCSSRLRFAIQARAAALALGASALLFGHSARAANDAFNTNPTASGGVANFTGNFTLGTTTPGAGAATPVTGDALFFGTSSTTTLNNDLTAGISFAGLTFNTGASAFTIGGNAFTLTGNITNNSASLQTINNAITLSGATRTFSAASGSLTFGGGITGFGNASDAIFTAASGQTITVSSFTGSSAGNDGILINGAGNTIIGAISESAATNRGFSLTQSGTGSLTLNGANNLRNNGTGTSVITLNSGTLNLANAAALSTTAGTNTNLVIAGGTLDATGGVTALTYTGNAATQNWNGSFTFTGTNSLNMGTGAVTLGANSTATISANTLTVGNLNPGGFTLTKAGTGTLSASGITLAGGGGVSSTAGALTSTGVLTLNAGGGTINTTGGTVGFTTITRNAGGTVDFSGTLANISTTTANTAANTIIGGYATVNGGTSFAVVSGGKIAVYSGATTVLPSTATASTTSQYTLAGSQTQTGFVSGNSLIISNTANSDTLALGANNLTLNGANGALLYNGGSDNNFAITGTGVIGGGTTSEFIVGTAAGTTLSISAPVVSATATAGSLTKMGTGTLTLSGLSSYTGATNLNAGTLKIGVAQSSVTGPLGSGTSALNLGAGATLDLQGNAVSVGTVTANTVGTNSIVTSTGAATLTLAGGSNLSTLTVNGAASLLVNGGSSLTTAAATLIAGTGSLGFQNNAAVVRDNNLQANLGTNGSLLFNGGGLLQTTTGQTLGTGNRVIVNGTGNQYNYQVATTINGAWTGSGRLLLQQGFAVGITVNGDLSAFAGTIDLQVAGTTAPNNSTVLSFGSGAATTGSALAAFTQSATSTGNVGTNTIQYTGTGSRTINFGDLSTSGAPAGSFASGTTLLQNGTASTTATFSVGALNRTSTYAGTIVNGTGTTAITKVGSGNWSLTGVNTYTGATLVSAGTLTLGATNSLAKTSGITVNSNATLSLAATSALATPVATTGTLGTTVAVAAGQVPITLSGGTLLRNGTGISAGSQSGTNGNVGIGLLTLTASSTIDYGTTGVGTLNFSSLAGLSSTNILSIVNFSGTADTTTARVDGTDDRFIVNQDLSSYLSFITINGNTATSEIALGNGEFELSVVAVPEPSTWVAGLLSIGAVSFHLRRRSRSAGQQAA